MKGKTIIKGIYSEDLCILFKVGYQDHRGFRSWRALNQDLLAVLGCGGATDILQHPRTKFQVGTNWAALQSTNRLRLPGS